MTMRLMRGDNRELLQQLDAQSVHAIVTSPPYWNLRDYGTPSLPWPAITYSPMPGLPACVEIPAMDCQLGLEPSLEFFIGHIVYTFQLARRVLRDDGTCWVNMGDSYAGSRKGGDSGTSTMHSPQPNHSVTASRRRDNHEIPRSDLRMPGLKPKDMVGQPWRVAFALQADGWWLRQDVIWAKPNPMPESTRDRCTKAHEYLFLLAKSERYAWDFEAMQEPVNGGAHARRPSNGVGFGHGYDEKTKPRQKWKTPDGWDTRTGEGGHGSFHADGREKGRVLPEGVGRREGPSGNPAERKLAEPGNGTKNNASMDAALADMRATRNRRSVWTVPSEPFKEAHFATFPSALIEPCIRASVPEGGTVLDIFGGAGTTGLVADRLQRNAIVMEINPAYADIAERRMVGDAPLFAEVT